MRINKSLITNQITGAGTGSVTSVAMTVPTGFVVSGSPITSSGTLSITFASGYSLPQFPSQTGNNGKYLTTDGTNLSWATVTGGGVSGTVNYLAKFDTTASVADSIIYENGFVGIGTTTAGTGSLIISSTTADNHLQLNGTAPSIRFTDTPTSATYNQVIGQVITANNFITNTVAGDLAIANASGGSILFGIGSTEALRIFTSTRNVAIGGSSTDTGDKLYVSGNIKSTAQLKLTGYTSTSSYPGTAAGYLAFDSSGNVLSVAGSGGSNIYSADGTLAGNRTLSLSTYYLRIAGSTTTSFFSTGNVVVGGTTDAGFKFDTQGTGRFTGAVSFTGGTSVAGSISYTSTYGLILYGNTGSQSDLLLTDRTGALRFRIVNGGDIIQTSSVIGGVGIGTSSGTTRIVTNATYGLSFWGQNATTYNLSLVENTGNFGLFINSTGQVKVGAYNSTYNNSAILEAVSTTKGFLPPRMTGAQAEAITTPAAGLMVYANSGNGTTITSIGWWGFDGTNWVKIG